ncbi:flagellar biosynthetic protein FliO [Steroidobacter flavus]|uniref:Flagellar biosynthetic protein FliO n=1 Tax=Steroidobacter flavus TaxID=1842136 RepID=A0ABV8T1A4_9GAMM
METRAGIARRVVTALALSVVLVGTSAAQDSTPLAQGRDIVQMPSMWRVVFVFLLIAGLAVGAAYALRRFSPNLSRGLAQQGPLRVIDRASVNAGLRVHLVEADGTRILIAEHRAGISMLQLPSVKNESP